MMMAADSDKKYKCYSKKLGNTDGSGCMPSISVPHSCLNDAHVNVAIEWFSGLITPFLLVAQGLSPREHSLICA
jgi:hypothetical protein